MSLAAVSNVRPAGRRLQIASSFGRRLLFASFAVALACDQPTGIPQAAIAGTWSGSDEVNSLGMTMTLSENAGIVSGSGSFRFPTDERPMTINGRLTGDNLIAVLSVAANPAPGSSALSLTLHGFVLGDELTAEYDGLGGISKSIVLTRR
jgi:hypothetical protein